MARIPFFPMTLERDLKARLLLRSPKEIPSLRLFSRTVARVRVQDRVIQAGIRGQADLWGVWLGGRHIELELKAAGGMLSKKQRVWQTFCLEWQIPHLVLRAHAGESIDTTVTRWLHQIYLTSPEC